MKPGTKQACQMSVKEEDVDKYFQLISKRFEELSILDKPGNIVNMDETGWGKEQQCKRRVIVGRELRDLIKDKLSQ